MRWTTSSSAASRRPSPDPEARSPGECGRVRPHSFFCLRGRPAGPRLRAPGARDQLLIGRDNGGLRGLFAFDLSAIPSAASITSAAFELWIPQLGLGTVKSLELGPLLKDFVEGSGNSSSSATAVGTRLGFTLAPAIFSEWQAIHWPGGNDPELVGDAADPDGDGLANLLECALGLSPLASDPAPTTIESPPGTRSRFVRLRVQRP